MARPRLGADPLSNAEKQQRHRAKLRRQREEQEAAEDAALVRRIARNAARRDGRSFEQEQEWLLEQAKAEAGSEWVRFRDDTAAQIARTIMQNLEEAKLKQVVAYLVTCVPLWEDRPAPEGSAPLH
jgi:hypothetical protein